MADLSAFQRHRRDRGTRSRAGLSNPHSQRGGIYFPSTLGSHSVASVGEPGGGFMSGHPAGGGASAILQALAGPVGGPAPGEITAPGIAPPAPPVDIPPVQPVNNPAFKPPPLSQNPVVIGAPPPFHPPAPTVAAILAGVWPSRFGGSTRYAV